MYSGSYGLRRFVNLRLHDCPFRKHALSREVNLASPLQYRWPNDDLYLSHFANAMYFPSQIFCPSRVAPQQSQESGLFEMAIMA